MDKAAIFLDGGYVSKVLRSHGMREFDFLRFSEKLCGMFSAERFRTYYYDCMPYQSSPPTPQETERYRAKDRFISSLRRNPRFEVRLGRLARHEKCGEIVFEQKGVDIYLSIDLALLSGRRDIQKAVLVTADSDFVPAINAAKEAGVLCAVCYSRKYRKPHD